MKRLLTLSALMFSLMLVPGCGGDTHESLAKETIDTMKKMVATLEGIKDEASAKSAKPTLTDLSAKMKDIETRMGKLPAPTEADGKAMESKYGKEMEEVSMKLQSQMFRIIGDPKIAAVLQDINMKLK